MTTQRKPENQVVHLTELRSDTFDIEQMRLRLGIDSSKLPRGGKHDTKTMIVTTTSFKVSLPGNLNFTGSVELGIPKDALRKGLETLESGQRLRIEGTFEVHYAGCLGEIVIDFSKGTGECTYREKPKRKKK